MPSMRYDLAPDSLIGQRVSVYCNLHEACWSILAKVGQKWCVVAHADAATLEDVTFRVRESGRQKAITRRRRNVHAFATGLLTSWDHSAAPGARRVRYNPFEMNCFVVAGESTPVNQETVAYFCAGKQLYIPAAAA